MKNPIVKPFSRLLALLIAMWCVSLAIAMFTARKAVRSTTACQTNIEMAQSLNPEIQLLRTYDHYIAEVVEKTSSADAVPSFRMLIAQKHPPSMPDSLEEVPSQLTSSGLRMTTAVAKWNAIQEERLLTIIEMVDSAPTPYRLASITLSPSGQGDSLKAEAPFHAFTK